MCNHFKFIIHISGVIEKCEREQICLPHEEYIAYYPCKGIICLIFLHLACRQLRFSLYSEAVTTKALTNVVFLYYPLSLALWSILCLMPLA